MTNQPRTVWWGEVHFLHRVFQIVSRFDIVPAMRLHLRGFIDELVLLLDLRNCSCWMRRASTTLARMASDFLSVFVINKSSFNFSNTFKTRSSGTRPSNMTTVTYSQPPKTSKFGLPAMALCFSVALAAADELPASGMLLDLDAAKGLTLEDGDKVAAWRNQVATSLAKHFVKRDDGRKQAGSGRPTLRKDIANLNGKPALVFLQQELCCLDEDSFDGLTNGKGHTWIAVLAVHGQRVGLKDVNSFFGNLRNGEKYEGVWGCFNDDNTLWWGARNGLTFGRFDANNPQLLGPTLEAGKFHLVAGRMGDGEGLVKLELFINSANPVATVDFPVNPKANPSRMVVGQERDAIQHPGLESFDGEIARFIIWERPLSDSELTLTMMQLRAMYFNAP